MSSFGTSPSRCRGRPGDVRLRLVVVVVGDEVLDGVVREELPELVAELRRERLVVGDHQRGPLELLDDPGHRRGLPCAGGTENRLEAVAGGDRIQQLDRARLVPGQGVGGSVRSSPRGKRSREHPTRREAGYPAGDGAPKLRRRERPTKRSQAALRQRPLARRACRRSHSASGAAALPSPWSGSPLPSGLNAAAVSSGSGPRSSAVYGPPRTGHSPAVVGPAVTSQRPSGLETDVHHRAEVTLEHGDGPPGRQRPEPHVVVAPRARQQLLVRAQQAR